MSASVYFFADPLIRSATVGAAVSMAFAAVAVFADAKQVIFVFTVSLLTLSLLSVKTMTRAVTYAIYTILAGIFVAWAAQTFFPALAVAANVDIEAGLVRKWSIFPIIHSYYESPIHWLVGLGPGHTVGRLGKLLLFRPECVEFFVPLGVTVSPVIEAAFEFRLGHWLTRSSSVWSPLFTWAGVWGDLGLLGLAVYLYLWWFVWWRLCLDDLSRFLLLTILILGGVFSWMEKPAYMLFLVSLIGLRWQQQQSNLVNRR